MESLMSLLQEKRTLRNAERSRLKTVQALENESRKNELMDLKDERLKCTERIVNNLNSITGHKHTISKIIHQSEQCIGLPISNAYHRQTLEFVSDAVKLVSNQKDLYKNLNSENSIDPGNLSKEVQCCAQSSANSFKGMKSSVDRVQTLMNNIHIIGEGCSDVEPGLETSIFDE